MITFTIAFRSLKRRKIRMGLIGMLIFLGTILIIVGKTFSLSAKYSSQQSIIQYFTGDYILYSSRSKEKPSPFAFTTPLPRIEEPQKIETWLTQNSDVTSFVSIAQNYGLLSKEKNGKKVEVPFFFYAMDPKKYINTFPNITMEQGVFYSTDSIRSTAGVVLSAFQKDNYSKNYSIDFASGDTVTLLSLNDGGSVNSYNSTILGIYTPKYYKNVFNYINFLDIVSYSNLYNFTGVQASSIPKDLNTALDATSDQDIFQLANTNVETLDTKTLRTEELSGYTMIAVKLNHDSDKNDFLTKLASQNFKISVATWREASGFFAYSATIIQGLIYGATALIFLIVIFILMNTLIITILERTSEIGTLRALGGEKQFITSLFLWESLLVNCTSAFVGMIISCVIIISLGGNHGITLPTIMQQYLTGGETLKLVLSPQPFLEAFLLIVLVSIIATIYPIKMALAISPLKAMSER